MSFIKSSDGNGGENCLEELLSRAREDDPEALKELYQLLSTGTKRQMIIGCLRQKGVKESDLSEALKSVVSIFLSRVGKFKGKSESKMMPYVFKVAWTVARGYRGLNDSRFGSFDELDLVTSMQLLSVDAGIDSLLKEADIKKALSRLTREQADALILRDLNGLSFNEVANLLNRSVKSTKKLIYEARRKMRVWLTWPNIRINDIYLTPSSLNPAPHIRPQRREFNIRIKIQNDGYGELPGICIEIHIDGSPFARQSVDLPVGEAEVCIATRWAAEEGSHLVDAILHMDKKNRLNKTDKFHLKLAG